MANYYCKWCGYKSSSIDGIKRGKCSKNPNGSYHVPYEGEEKSQYVCKWCGKKASSISSLTSGTCPKNPEKRHVPI